MTKLVTYTSGDRPRLGAVQGDLIVDLISANDAFPQDVPSGNGWAADSVSFLAAGAPALKALKDIIEKVPGLDAADARRDAILVRSADMHGLTLAPSLLAWPAPAPAPTTSLSPRSARAASPSSTHPAATPMPSRSWCWTAC